MKNVRQLGELRARIISLEERLSAVEAEMAGLRPPSVAFVSGARLDVGTRLGHAVAVAFTAKGGMSVWVPGTFDLATRTRMEVSA